MKKTNFFKLLMVGAAALALGFTSCQNGPSQGDFDKLCERVDALEEGLQALQKKVDGLEYVKSVTKTETNDATVYTVTHGNPAGTLEIVVPKGGNVGVPNSAWLKIGENGNWFINDVDTGEAAIATMPRIKVDGDQRYWEFPVIEGNDIAWKRGESAPAYSYAVEGAGGWTIWMPTKEDPKTLVAITISKSSGGLGKIDILGWVQGYDNASSTISRNNELEEPDHENDADANSAQETPLYFSQNQTFVVYYNWIEEFEGESNGASFSDWAPVTYAPNDTQDTDLPFWANGYEVSPANLLPFDADGDGSKDSQYLYWNYNQITEGNGTGPVGAYDYSFGTLNVSKTAWDGGRYQIKAKNVLNILDSQDKGFIVQVHPITVPFAEYKNLTLQDSKGNVLPVGLKQPVLITGLLTRAAANSALYFVEGSNFPKGEFATREAYAEKFTANAQYSLVTEDGIRSEYTPFTITPTYLASIEAQVIKVDDKGIHAPKNNVLASFYVEKDKWNKLEFDQDYIIHPLNASPKAFVTHAEEITPIWDGDEIILHGSTSALSATGSGVAHDSSYFHPLRPVGNGFLDYTTRAALQDNEDYLSTNAVVDWYIKVGSNDQDETYVTNVFGIQFNAEKTEFRATKIPDGLTEAMFNMRVFKLGVDGKIYLQYVKINVTRQSIVTPIPISPYIVQDEFPDAVQYQAPYANGMVNNFYDVISSPLNVDLAVMFNDLRGIADVEEENLANRWMDDEWGAKTYEIVSVMNVTKNQNQTDRFDPEVTTNVVAGNYGLQPATFVETAAGNGTRMFPADQQPTAGKSVLKWIGRDNTTSVVALERGSGLNLSLSTLYDARKLDLFPNYAYSVPVDGDVRTFDIGDDYVITVDFFDKNDRKLNSIEIKFTPQRPVLDRLFQKQPRRWNEDQSVLMAYYDLPGIFPQDAWRETKFYGTDVKANDDWHTLSSAPLTTPLNAANSIIGRVAWNWLGGTAADEVISRTSTYYNVFNPGGVTDLKHTSWRPLDGGYLKVGQRGDEENPKQWVAYTQVQLKNPTGAFEGGHYSDFIGTPGGDNIAANYPRLPGTAYMTAGNGVQNPGFTAGTVVQLYNQTNQNGNLAGFANAATAAGQETPNYTNIPFADDATNPNGGNAYGDEIPMRWEIGPYIGFYHYTADEVANNDFKIKVMSALAEGRIEATDKAIENMGGNYTPINDDHIKMYDYAGNPRSIFKENVPNGSGASNLVGYTYTYIAKVLFYRPYQIDDYDIIDENDGVNNNGQEARLATGTGANFVKAHLPILTKLTNFAGPTKIHVKVYDRFGRTLEQDVDINIVDELRQ